jgi:uroporphyrin-III C-methyltransferase / precorrin-2 dehydrogenase / sirohydrochlorin ferrochelatase
MTATLTTPHTPAEARPPRMDPLARLPVFFALDGRRAMIAGGTPGAAWKAELLSAAGAIVDVYAADASDEMQAVAIDPPRGAIVIHRREWTASDFAGSAIAVGACENETEAQRFSGAARAAGVPVNVVDKPKFCDFAFGAIVNRSPMVIGISTDGAAPVFGQAIRGKLEALIPRGFAQWAAAARRWRADVQVSGLSFNARRRFWQLFTERAVAYPDSTPQEFDYAMLLQRTRAEGERVEQGSVTLVGAGPGDPELLTLRAVRALQSADVILFDDIVPADVLDFARREARKLMVGKTSESTTGNRETGALMAGLAKSGRRVVRLMGGPMSAERAQEEMTACRRAGIAVQVVPGVGSALADSALADSVAATAEPDQRKAVQ